MNAMHTDEDLTRLMTEAAESFEVPEPSFDRPAAVPRLVPWQSPWLKGAAAVAAVALGLVGLANLPGGGVADSDRNAGTASRDVSGTDVFPGALSAPQVTTESLAGGGSVASVPADPEARVVKTGEITLVVDHGKVTSTVTRIQSLVTGLRGFVSENHSEEAGEHPTARMTVRVPVASFEPLIAKVRGLGAKVVSQTSSGKDITETYADTQAQIQSLKAARERYLVILSRARTIGETLTVQQRVDEVQGQIDRLEGQRRVLANQSDLGTLTISVSEEGAGQEAYSAPSGWSKAWDDAKDGFTGGVQSILANSGRALLVLLCAAALVLLGRFGWRLVRRQLV